MTACQRCGWGEAGIRRKRCTICKRLLGPCCWDVSEPSVMCAEVRGCTDYDPKKAPGVGSGAPER